MLIRHLLRPLVTIPLFLVPSIVACAPSDAATEDEEQGELGLEALSTKVVSGVVASGDGGKIRILKLASQSVFAPDASRAKSVPICQIGPGFPSTDPHERKDPRLAHFNRAKVEGDRFSVEVPENPGLLMTKTCKYVRSEQTVLKFTALTDEGVRFRFEVPVEFRSDAPRQTAPVEIVDGRATAPIVVAERDSQITVRIANLPREPRTISGEMSFAEVAQKVRADAITSVAQFPNWEGASTAEISAAIFTNTANLDKRSLRIRRDQSRILVHDGEEKADGAKAFHPLGACSTARWRITKPTPFSGLFSTNAEVDAIVRISAAGNNGTTKPDLGLVHRLLGMGIKLFPGASPEAKTESQNILLFDEFGPHGNPSPWIFKKRDGSALFYANWIFGNDPITHGNVNMFARAVHAPRTVPLTSLATVRPDGSFEKASQVRSPRFIKLVPIVHREAPPDLEVREELDRYGDGDIEFAIHLLDESATDGSAIVGHSDQVGVLTQVSKPLVSAYCDRRLQFHHAPQ